METTTQFFHSNFKERKNSSCLVSFQKLLFLIRKRKGFQICILAQYSDIVFTAVLALWGKFFSQETKAISEQKDVWKFSSLRLGFVLDLHKPTVQKSFSSQPKVLQGKL